MAIEIIGFIGFPSEWEITHRILGAGIYANIWGILMGSMLPYIAAPWPSDPMGNGDIMRSVGIQKGVIMGFIYPKN